jgi:hypothetical protein
MDGGGVVEIVYMGSRTADSGRTETTETTLRVGPNFGLDSRQRTDRNNRDHPKSWS